MYNNQQVAQLPIQDAVKLPGGNGLASPLFEIEPTFMRLVGWQHVEEGVEALLCEGEIVPRTRLTSDIWRLIGRRKHFRRVLLQPAPLTDLVGRGLTQDHFELSLVVSVKFTVADPLRVAALTAPLDELRQLLQGLIAEYIHSENLQSIVSDDGKLRDILRRRLQNGSVVKDLYSITEVLKAIPEGDPALFDVMRRTQTAALEQGLIEQEGQNQVLQAGYEREIASQQAALEDRFKQIEFEREMQMMMARERAETERAMLNAIAEVAKGVGDVKGVIGLFQQGTTGAGSPLTSPPQTPAQALPSKAKAPAPSAEAERAALQSLQTAGLITDFEIFETDGRVTGAMVQREHEEIVLMCPKDYPESGPDVVVRFRDDTTFKPQVTWIAGISQWLAQVIPAVIPQIPGNSQR